MPHLSPKQVNEARGLMEDELVIIGAPKHPGKVSINIPQGNEWRAPRLSLNRARAVRHRELILGRSMTPTEADEYIRLLCAGSPPSAEK